MKRENRFDIVPTIKPWGDSRPTISLRRSNQKMNHSQPFRIRNNFLIQRKSRLFIRSSKPDSMKPFRNPSIRLSRLPIRRYRDLYTSVFTFS